MRCQNIVVGVDGSPGSLEAVRWCAGVAVLCDAKVIVVHALSPWIEIEFSLPPLDSDTVRSTLEASLQDKWSAPLAEAGVDFRTTLADEYPVSALIGIAKDVDADLIVVGKHGHGAFAPTLVGGVTHKVLHRAPCPTAVIPPPAAEPERSRQTYDLIVGVDGSQHAAKALRWAIDYAAAAGAGVTSIEVVPSAAATTYAPSERDAAEDGGVHIGVAHRVVVGHPGDVLTAASREARLLVVGSRGRTAIAEFLTGSTANFCAARAACPVVVVP